MRLAGSNEVPCLVLDADDEWMKIRFTGKKDKIVTQILRIDAIDSIEVLEGGAAQ